MKRINPIHLVLVIVLAGSLGCQPEGSAPDHAHGTGSGQHTHQPEGDHEHGTGAGQHTHEKKTPGPNGGRLIASVSPQVEFLVKEDRHVQLTFVDSALKPIDVPEATVSLIGGDRQAPSELGFQVSGTVLISEGALPEGNVVPVILSFQIPPASDPIVERFNVDFSICSECKLVEYACICGH